MSKVNENTEPSEFDYDKMAQDLAEQTEQQYKNSIRGIGILKEGMDVKVWNPSDDEHEIDVIPFIAGPYHPEKEEGLFAYVLDLWVHYGVGPNNETFVCLNPKFNKFPHLSNPYCPACMYVDKLRKQLVDDEAEDKELIKEITNIKPSKRSLYNVWIHDSEREEKEGVKIWHVSHHIFGKVLSPLMKAPREGGYVNFSHPKEGKSIYFQKQGKGLGSYTAIQFMERQIDVTPQILKQAKQLDTLVYIPTKEEIQAALDLGIKDDGYEFEEEPRQKTRFRRSVPSENEDNDNDNESSAFQSRKISRSRRNKPEFVEQEASTAVVPGTKSEILLPEKEAEAEPESKTESEPKSEDLVCPNGYVFGEDIDNYPECPQCDIGQECENAYTAKFSDGVPF